MANKNKVLAVTFLIALTMILAMAFSSATLVKPATAGTVLGTYVLNATNSSGLLNMLNCTFYAKSASTANSSWTYLANASNNSLGVVNVSFNSALLEDASDYIFNATCANSTVPISQQGTSTGVIIDNTIPQAPSSLVPVTNNLFTNASFVVFSSTVTNRNTTACTFSRGRDGGNYVSYTATYSASTCSYNDSAFSDSSKNGNYYWYFTASDGLNTTSSATNILNVQIPGGGGGLVIPHSTTNPLSNNQNNLLTVIIIVIIGVIVYVIVKKKK
jgi:hypothetical protein